MRLDSNIAHHDKMLTLMGMRDGHKAAALYMFSLAWSGGNGTDGFIPKVAVPILYGTERHAHMLVEVQLWEHAPGGYRIRNWELRQETATVTELKREIAKSAGRKSACIRNHGPACGCWKATNGSTVGSTSG